MEPAEDATQTARAHLSLQRHEPPTIGYFWRQWQPATAEIRIRQRGAMSTMDTRKSWRDRVVKLCRGVVDQILRETPLVLRVAIIPLTEDTAAAFGARSCFLRKADDSLDARGG